MNAKSARIERAARRLLAMMDRQYGTQPFSANVTQAKADLEALLATEPDPRDKTPNHPMAG